MDDRDPWGPRVSHIDAADAAATRLRVVPSDPTEVKARDFEPHDLLLVTRTHELLRVVKPLRNRIQVVRGVGSQAAPIPSQAEVYLIGSAKPRG